MKFWPGPFKPWTYLISIHFAHPSGIATESASLFTNPSSKNQPQKGVPVTVIGMFRHSGRFCVDNDTQLDGKETHLKF